MRFSVIIPVRDDPVALGVALDGLRLQTHPPDEVIVVNAGPEPLAPVGSMAYSQVLLVSLKTAIK